MRELYGVFLCIAKVAEGANFFLDNKRSGKNETLRQKEWERVYTLNPDL